MFVLMHPFIFAVILLAPDNTELKAYRPVFFIHGPGQSAAFAEVRIRFNAEIWRCAAQQSAAAQCLPYGLELRQASEKVKVVAADLCEGDACERRQAGDKNDLEGFHE